MIIVSARLQPVGGRTDMLPPQAYKHYGNDTVSYVPFLLGPPAFYTANLDVLRQVASSSGGRSFYKSPASSGALLYASKKICYICTNNDLHKIASGE